MADAGFRQRDATRLVDRFGAVAVNETLAKAVYKQRVGEIKTSLRGFIFCDLKNDIPQDERVEAEQAKAIVRKQTLAKKEAQALAEKEREAALQERQKADQGIATMILANMPDDEKEVLRQRIVSMQGNPFAKRAMANKPLDHPLVAAEVLKIVTNTHKTNDAKGANNESPRLV